MKIEIQGGHFDPERHIYTDSHGRFCPSVTQIISLAGYSNLGDIDSRVLANAADRGTRLHKMTEVFDRDGESPDPWSDPAELARFERYQEWKEREQFVPELIEKPLISSLYGYRFGVTVDRVGTLRGRRAIVELKFTAQSEWYWGVQLAAQEVACTNSDTLGRYIRVACHVGKAGHAKTIVHRDPMDLQRFLFALGVVWARIDNGEDIEKAVTEGK